MGKGKKALVTALAVGVTVPALVVPMGGEVKAAEFNGYTYVDNGDGTAIITDYSTTATKDVVIPETINGLMVNEIGEKAFYNKGIKTINVPGTVKKIGKMAFKSNYSTKLTLGEGIEVIEENAFDGHQLSVLKLPNSLKVIKKYSFYSMYNNTYTVELTDLKIGNQVEVIEDYAFGNARIETLHALPDTLKTIGNNAFSFDNRFTTLAIPDSVEYLGNKAFGNIYGVKAVKLPDNLKYIGEDVFATASLRSIIIPEGVTHIGNRAFRSNRVYNDKTGKDKIDAWGNQLTEVVLPQGLEVIGDYAFGFVGSNGGKNPIKNIVIPPNVKRIGDYAFNGATTTEIKIPEGVEYIGHDALGRTTLTELKLPSTLKTIGNNVFSGSTITELVLPEGLTSIGSGAFKGNKLNKIVFPSNLVTLGSSAFEGNELEKVLIPNTVTSIGSMAFKGNKISEIQIPSSVITMPSDVLDGNQFVASFLNLYGQGGSRAHAVAIEKGYTFNGGVDMPNPPTIDPPVVDPKPEVPGEPTETPSWSFADPTAPFVGVKPTITLVGGKPANDILITDAGWVTEETVVTTAQGDLTFKPDGKGNTLVSAKTGLGTKTTSETVNVEFEGTHFMNIKIKPVPVLDFNFGSKK